MKFLLISNGNLAEEIYRAMKGFYANPEIEFMGFDEEFTERIAAYVQNTKEEILIACDMFGSAAFNEAAYWLQKFNCFDRAGIICGMNLPMVFKLYGLKDVWPVKDIKSLYQDGDAVKHDIVVY